MFPDCADPVVVNSLTFHGDMLWYAGLTLAAFIIAAGFALREAIRCCRDWRH